MPQEETGLDRSFNSAGSEYFSMLQETRRHQMTRAMTEVHWD